MWEVSSGPESTEMLVLRVENSTSGWGSLKERSAVGSRFSRSLFRDNLRTVPESVRTCGFKSNSSNLDRARRMRDAVLLSSWDSFSATLPSISTKTCMMYSSVTSEMDVVLRLAVPSDFFSFSFEQLPAFAGFLTVPYYQRGKKNSIVLKTDFFISKKFLIVTKFSFPFNWKSFQSTTVNLIIKISIGKIKILLLIALSFLLFISFPWREKRLFARPVKVQIGKSTVIILTTKAKRPTLAGKKLFFVHFFLHRPRLLHLLAEEVRAWSIRNGHQSA